MKPIFEYDDYRSFMNDFYQWKKRTSAFSWREFAQKGGFTSPNYVKLVCEGKSGLSKPGIERVADAMNLVGAEREYFRKLVKYSQAKNRADKIAAYTEMTEIANSNSVHILQGESASFYESRIYPTLRELAPMMPKATPSEMSKKCRGAFSAEEVRNALAYLTRAKFLKKSANGTYEQVDKSLQMSVTALPMHVRKMHSEMATLAKDAIEEFPVEERNFTGITMGIDDKDYAEILKELENCRKRILSIATAKKGGNRVYRLNLQMFPLTDKVERTEAK